jgi:hypothetical protein
MMMMMKLTVCCFVLLQLSMFFSILPLTDVIMRLFTCTFFGSTKVPRVFLTYESFIVISGISCCVGVVPSCSNSESVEISVAEFSSLSSVDESFEAIYQGEQMYSKSALRCFSYFTINAYICSLNFFHRTTVHSLSLSLSLYCS